MDGKIMIPINADRYRMYMRRRFICRVLLCLTAIAAIVSSAVFKAYDAFTAEAFGRLAIDERITIVKTDNEKEDILSAEDEPAVPAVPEAEAETGDTHPDGGGDVSGDTDTVSETEYADLSRSPGVGEVIINNSETDYDIDPNEIRSMAYPVSLTRADTGDPAAPAVLIIHTHATEAYDGEGKDFRSEDITKNVVAVGAVILERLKENGVSAVQCTTLHDAGDFYQSYSNSEASVKEYLEKYPSIRYILDVHRDSITRNGGEQIATLADVNGSRAAQLMFVVGTDKFGADHPFWRENLRVAVSLQLRLNSAYGNIARPISLRGASFNEQYSPGYLLLEVGSSGNTLGEAKISAAAFADVYAALIKENLSGV